MKSFFVALLFLFPIALCLGQRNWDTIPTLPQLYQQRYEQFKKEPVIKGRILFLGNSITQGGNWKKLLKDTTVINRGIGGDVTFGILNRLSEVIQREPAKLFLLIGINDISKNIPDEIIMENIFSIVTKVKAQSPQTEIFVQSVLPVNPTFEKFPENYNKQDHVVLLNGQLQKFSSRFKYTYIDLYSKFLDDNNQLNKKFSSDGLHLNEAGYQHWVSILKSLNYL
jgi:lysophospholipase L1-like esterase